MVVLESSAIIFIRAAEYKHVDGAEASHFPISHLISGLYPDSHSSLENIIYFIAMVKIVSAMAWLMVIASNLTMGVRSEEHTSELQSLMRSSYAVFCLNTKIRTSTHRIQH